MGGEVTLIGPGSPKEDGISGTQEGVALDREANNTGLSEGGVAVETGFQ